MKITLLPKYGSLQCRIDGRVMDLLRGLPGRSRWVDRELRFEPSAANVDYLKSAFPDAVWEDASGRLQQIETVHAMEADSIALKKNPLPPEAASFPFKTKPRNHQLRGWLWARDRPYFAFFMDMGTGKTKTTIDVIAYRWANGDIDRAVIFAPNGVHEQWALDEIPKHMPELVEYKTHVHKSGRKLPPDMLKRDHVLRILVINIEAMSHKSGFEIALSFARAGDCMAIVDESTTIKTPGSQRSKNTRKVGELSVLRGILCGAPITRSIEDIYGQFLFLHPDALGFSSFYTFRNRYCDTAPAYPGAPYGVVRVTGLKNMEEFTHKVDAHSYRVTKDQCLDLPPKVYLTRRVELTPEQRKIYQSMATECYAQLGSRIIDVQNTVGKILRLQQIICGHLPDEDGGYELIPSNRIKEIDNWLEECGDKVVIWARFTADIDMLCKAMGNRHTFVRYDGSVKQSDRWANRDRWLNDRQCRVMIANPAAAARGGNWQIAQDVGYFSNSFDADHRWQSEDRTHRDGMVGTCTYTDFISPGTVDVKIVAALRDKKSVAQSVLDDPAEWREALKQMI